MPLCTLRNIRDKPRYNPPLAPDRMAQTFGTAVERCMKVGREAGKRSGKPIWSELFLRCHGLLSEQGEHPQFGGYKW